MYIPLEEYEHTDFFNALFVNVCLKIGTSSLNGLT